MNLTAQASLLPQELSGLGTSPPGSTFSAETCCRREPAISRCGGCQAQVNPACPQCVLLPLPGPRPALQPCPRGGQAGKQGAAGVCKLRFPLALAESDPLEAAA